MNAVYFRDWYAVISVPRFYDGKWTLELTFDHSVAGLFLDNGIRIFTQVVYPDTPYTAVSAEGDAALTVSTIE